jgi:hypothetical protein
VHGHLDLESLGRFVVPFPHVGYPTEQHRKAEADHAFVESLRARAQSKTAIVVDGKIDVDGEVLVRAEVVNDSATGVAVDHVRVEATSATRLECSNP